MNNPVNDIIGGMMQGAALGNMLRRAAIEDEMVKREQVKFAQEQEMEDFRRRALIGQYTRPVEGGMVEEERTASLPVFDYANPGKPKFEQTKTSFRRLADKSRVAKMKLSDGTEISGEMLSPEEQHNREFSRLITEIREKGRLANELGLEGQQQLYASGFGPKALAETQAKALDERTRQAQQFTLSRDEAGRKAHMDQIKAQQTFQSGEHEKDRNARVQMNREDNQAADRRVEASERRAASAENDRQTRANRTEARAIQKRMDDIQKEKRTLDAERERIGALSKTKDWRDDKKGVRTQGEAKYREVTARLSEISKDERELKARMDALYASGPVTTADALFRSYGR